MAIRAPDEANKKPIARKRGKNVVDNDHDKKFECIIDLKYEVHYYQTPTFAAISKMLRIPRLALVSCSSLSRV